MKKRNELFLLLAALIWGFAFVAQTEGGDALGPYTFNCVRNFLGTLVLLPVIRLLDHMGFSKAPSSKEEKKTLLMGGISCGIILAIASNLQQLGLYFGAGTGKAGFLTTTYILLVPILGLFLKKTCGWNIWVGVAIALAGLYLLCIKGEFRLEYSDILLLLCALVFSMHILVVDHFSPLVDGVRMSCIQFTVCGVLTIIPTILSDIPAAGGLAGWLPGFFVPAAWVSLLYAGFCSSGIAYTLQIVGQEGVNPTVASLLMSLESVFSVLAGWLLLKQALSPKELAGCALIFAAVVLAQIPVKK